MFVSVNEKTNVISITTTEEKSSVVLATSQGPAGPPGPAGSAADIGGYPIDVAGLHTGDVLIFSGASWVNENKVTLTDGGNF